MGELSPVLTEDEREEPPEGLAWASEPVMISELLRVAGLLLLLLRECKLVKVVLA